MFRSTSGGRTGSNGEQDQERRRLNHEESAPSATPAQMIQIAQTASRPRPIHMPPHPLNETPDETEPSYSYEEKSSYLPYDDYDDKDEVADAFHRRFAASSSSGYHGRKTGRGSSLGSSSFTSPANDNQNPAAGSSSSSPSLLTSSLRSPQDGNNGSSGGSNFWRTTSRQPGSSSSNKSGGKNTRTASDDGTKDSRSNLPNNNNKNINNRSSKGVLRGRRRLRSSGQSTKQIDSDNKHGRPDFEGGTSNNLVKSKDRNQNKSSGESSSVPLHQQNQSTSRFPHSNSASSLGSTGSASNNEARMKSKQRNAVRRLKLDAQQQLGEDGGIVDNGFYHEVPTVHTEQTDGSSKTFRDYDVTMSALEEEVTADFNATDDDDSHSLLHSNLKSPTKIESNSIPKSTLLASAAGAAAAAVSEYRYSNNRINNRNPGDSSLTHHINNLRHSTPPFQQQQPVVPVLLNDNTDNRSTTSTMSDLSVTESNTNRHGNSLTSLNSLLSGKPVPIESPTSSSRKNSHFHHQRFPNAVSSGEGVSGMTSTNIGNNLNNLGIRNANRHYDGDNATASSDNGGHSLLGPLSPSTFVTTTTIGINHGRRIQTPEFNRHGSGRNGDNNNTRKSATDNSQLANKIALLLDACEAVRFPFKKKLILDSLRMTAADIPVKDFYGTVLGQSLHKLSLSGNRLSTIPRKLVTCLPNLKNMDISQCELHQLPERWNLPQLKRLNLSHNRLSDFPEETMLEGIPELQVLNMFGNKVSAIIIPHNPKLLARLETLDLGYNDLADLPDELDRLKSLRILKVMNNFLEKIPMRVCNMELKAVDVSNNPVIQPPIETCERGIGSMKRFYHCLSMEEQSKPNALEALQSKARIAKQQKKKVGAGLRNFSKPKRRRQVSVGRLHSDESSQSSNSKSKSQKSQQSSLSTQDRRSTISDTKASTVTSVDSDSQTSSTVTQQRSKSLQLPSINNLSPRQNIDSGRSASMPSINKILDANIESILSSVQNVDSDKVTINETLKVIFVGMAMAGKTSMIKRLIEGEDAVIPKKDQRTIGVDIYEWDPTIDKRYEHIDNRIQLQDPELERLCPNANVKFSVWDFAGQHVYHATHELFFSPRALYVLVWDMGAKNPATRQQARNKEDIRTDQRGAFKLGYESDASESDDDDYLGEEEARRAELALERDIDEKVQFWVDCIQSSVPGAAILPVATFDDIFQEGDHYEAKRRCDILKERLLKHEARRIQGIKDRLKAYVEQNRANDAPALRLRKLLGSYTRPKIIFGNDGEDSVVRVSGTEYTGFAKLTEKITNISTGRDTAKLRYPIFRGHVGARIPRMRLKVLDVVRSMRDRFKVVEWGYFFQQLQEHDITDVGDVSDALHFLTNIGELSYFGDILPDRTPQNRIVRKEKLSADGSGNTNESFSADEGVENDENGRKSSWFSSNGTNARTSLTSEDGSILTHDDQISGGLSQFVFLNPRWLVAAVACILRHDLDREIQYTRRSLAVQGHSSISSNSFDEANMNCPVITSEDACMLWRAKKVTRKAAERAEESSAGIKLKPFEFLQLLLVRFRVFIPIDLGIERAFLGGTEYARKYVSQASEESIPSEQNIAETLQSTYFFLPSLLGPGEPTEAWTYKSTDSWKATLCHSILFPDGVPPGLMERITATVLSNLYAMAHKQDMGVSESWQNSNSNNEKSRLNYEGNISVKEILCWRNAFLVKLGMQVQSPNGEYKESIVEIFTALVDKDSNYCVGSDQMPVGTRRLITSGKGQEGDGGRKIWMGGYLAVTEAVSAVMEEYGGLEYEKQGFCPECLAQKSVSEAHSWARDFVGRVIEKGETRIRCRHGHRVDIRLVCPLYFLNNKDIADDSKLGRDIQPGAVVPISDLFRSVVVVGLWDGKTGKIVRVGSGFIADKKRGLIVTASHTLMNIWGEKGTPFGENYYGLPDGKVVIGVIDRKKGERSVTHAVFRYFAEIVAKDPKIETGICHIDACVLRITTRLDKDVGGNGEGCGAIEEHLLKHNPWALKQEKLQQLKITDKCEYDEWVKIIGYNQGGEGLMGPGVVLNFSVDFARGYVCKKFAVVESNINDNGASQPVRHRFKPREEIVVNCETIVGHSGGPCVNQQGEVIGILSRADPAENKRCYLVPTEEWKPLLKQAKRTL